MEPRIANANPDYARAALIAPTTHGYLHLAAAVRPGRLPLVVPNAERRELVQRVAGLARDLAQLAPVVRTAVFRARVMPPVGRQSAYLRERGAAVRLPDFDVVVLVETTSPETAREVQATPAYDTLVAALTAAAEHTHVMAACNAKRVGDVDTSRQGLFLFNYFVADDAEVALQLWDYLAGWYAAETGLDNSLVLRPLAGAPADYAFVNFARIDAGLPGSSGIR